jgi:hypothetical protein
MPKHVGIFPIQGSMGNVSFYVDKNGNNIVRKKGGPSRRKVKKDPSFRKFRANGSDFGNASGAGKTVRGMFSEQTVFAREGSYCHRMTALMQRIGATDELHAHGEKRPLEGKIEMLEGFEWNDKLSLEDALDSDTVGYIDPATGKMHMLFTRFTPNVMIKKPEGASHFQIVAAGGCHGNPGKQATSVKVSSVLPIDGKETPALSFDLEVATGNSLYVLAAGILFFEEVDGAMLPLHGGAFSIVKAVRG